MERVPTIAGTSTRREVDGSSVRLIVRVGSESAAQTSRLLTTDLFEVVSFLTEAESFDASQSVLIDVQVPSLTSASQRAEAAAFVSACKALVHAWVREQTAKTCTVNMIVTDVDQEISRTQSVEYFADANGRFSHGSVIDLREAA